MGFSCPDCEPETRLWLNKLETHGRCPKCKKIYQIESDETIIERIKEEKERKKKKKS